MIIDRFEGDYAVVETESGMIDIERSKLPANAAEGDVIELCGGVYVINSAETAERREKAASRLRRLMGDVND